MHPPVEFRLRLGLHPAKPSRPCRSGGGSSHGLCFPSAHQESKVHVTRAKACPLRSVLRVWLPSRRLAPFESLPALFHAGGALGIHPSELPPRGRLPGRFRSGGPTYRLAPRYMPAAEAASPPAGRRFLGFDPSESSSRPRVWLAPRPPDAPLGFALPGLVGGGLFPDFAGNPPARFVDPGG